MGRVWTRKVSDCSGGELEVLTRETDLAGGTVRRMGRVWTRKMRNCSRMDHQENRDVWIRKMRL